MTTPRRTIFRGAIVQRSSLSVGGTHGRGDTDAPIARDGKGRATLTGEAIAGALSETVRRLRGSVPPEISGKGHPRSRHRSAWRVYTTHPEAEGESEVRPGVTISHRTGAAAEDLLFDAETLPLGTRWPFLLEVERSEAAPDLVAITLEALAEWMRGRAWLGAGAARGLGWVELVDLQRLDLGESDDAWWPDSSRCPWEILGKRQLDWRSVVSTDHACDAEPRWWFREVQGEIEVKPPGADDYGLDGLAIGGHEQYLLGAEWDPKHYWGLPLEAERAAAERETFAPDHGLAQTRRAGKLEAEPYIPGSSLRGPLRHALAWWLRSGRAKSSPGPEIVDEIFGTVEESARLLIQDASLVEGAHWSMAWLHHHAEDEFSAGVYASSKFDRLVLIEGRFAFRILLEGRTQEVVERAWEGLHPALRLAQDGRVALGSGKWRGSGWIGWRFAPDLDAVKTKRFGDPT